MRASSPQNPLPAQNITNTISDKKLDEHQKRVIGQAVIRRKNFCIVGQAGTGKSTLVTALVNRFHEAAIRTQVVAMTGTAALNVRGRTIHGFAGFGHGKPSGIEDYLKFQPAVRDRLRNTQVLIIDEISMVDNEMFERLHRVFKKAKDNYLPFGGLQVIVVGDFCQLPPVKPFERCFECGQFRRKQYTNGVQALECSRFGSLHGVVYERDQWAFKAPCWNSMNFDYILLEHIHRQEDPRFQMLLHKSWKGTPFTVSEIDLLENHNVDVKNAVKLFSLNDGRDDCNNKNLGELDGIAHEYRCRDHFVQQHHDVPDLNDLNDFRVEDRRLRHITLKELAYHRYEAVVRLKKGMPVILTYNLNIDRGLVNGSQGVITRFKDYNALERPRVHYRCSNDEPQQATYMASLRQDQTQEFMDMNMRMSDDRRYPQIPIVKFHNCPDEIPIWPDCCITEHGFQKPHSLLMRTQVPLMAGWALTIHKAQGMTLESVEVDLSQCFSFGQTYVALSRGKALRGLKVKGLGQKSSGHAMSDEVKEFLQTYCGVEFD